MSDSWITSNIKSTIVITGGGSGIGKGLAIRFLQYGHNVIIIGRRLEQLEKTKQEYPNIITIQGDISNELGRYEVVNLILQQYPQVNVWINNAGIQNRLPALTDITSSHGKQLWNRHKQEIATNFEAPIHLCMLLIPHLMSKEFAKIINVSSGLAFVPMSRMPIYCSTKAGLHSFTMSLRAQLKDTPITVLEIIPPAVNTDLGGVGLHNFGEPLDEFSDYIFQKMMEDNNLTEIGYKYSEKTRNASREEVNALFEEMNSRR